VVAGTGRLKRVAANYTPGFAKNRGFLAAAVLSLALASGLTAVGIYGVVAFLVAQGTREMGVRMALGATPRGIGLLVVRHGLLIAAAGIVLGVAGAVVLTRLMQSLVFGIASTDPVTYLFRRRARGGDRARRRLYPCPAGVPVGSHAIAPLRQLVAHGIRDGLDHLADLLL
jgi:ABC-type antimicrobial peptide transport system permease subunit